MNIAQESEDIANWLHKKLDGLEISSSETFRASASCFDVAMEHQASISILFHAKLYASAFALVRCEFEAYVRGLWLAYRATDKQVSDYWHGKFNLKFQKTIDEIEKIDAYSSGVISQAKKSHWPFLNRLTHTGSDQILRRNTESSIEPNYEEKEIIAVGHFVNSIALLAGLDVVSLARSSGNRDSLENDFAEKIQEYNKKP